MSNTPWLFPERLHGLREKLLGQESNLRRVASLFADAIARAGLVHVYANGHSRIPVEELCVRMGALTGFHPLLQVGLTTFTDIVGCNGIRVNQAIEKFEGIADRILDEFDIAPGEPLLVITATGQTPAAVDMALAWTRRFPDNPIIGLCCLEQSRRSAAKHSSGKNLTHVIEASPRGILLNNGMPSGDLSVEIAGRLDTYSVCPLSSIGALSVIQSLNELTLRELDRRGIRHCVLRNMHTGSTQANYDQWLRDQRRRYARALHAGT